MKTTQAAKNFLGKIFTSLEGIETFEREGTETERREMSTYHLRNGKIHMGKYITHIDHVKKGSVKIAQVWHGQRPMTLVVYGKKAFLVRRNVFIKLNGLAVKIPNYHGELISATIA